MTSNDPSTSPVTYKEIARYPGYRFGDDGSVWSIWSRSRQGGWRRKCPTLRRGRYHLSLTVDGVTTYPSVHRLILEAFDGPCPDGMQCCHNDGDATNNHPDNLRWDTPKANAADAIRHGTHFRPIGSRHGFAKLVEADIHVIRGLSRKGWTFTRVAAKFDVNPSSVRGIIAGRHWKHVEVDRVREELATQGIASERNMSLSAIARELWACAGAWESEARLVGNVRAADIRRLCESHILKQRRKNDDCLLCEGNGFVVVDWDANDRESPKGTCHRCNGTGKMAGSKPPTRGDLRRDGVTVI